MLLVLGAGLVAYIPWLGSYGLLDPTDSFFLESGRELLEKNQFLLPLNNYVPWLDKPILFFWMVAGAYKCFGINAFVGRLPAALSAVAAALIIYCGSRPMLRRSSAAFAALAFLATPLCSIVGHVCLTDMTLCALICGSILFLFKGLEYASTKDLWIGYVFVALSMLCKGPIAIILCGLAFLPYLFSKSSGASNFFKQLLKLKPIEGAAIVLAFNLPWYIMASLATNGEFLVAFFWTQNFGRMVGTVNHQEPFYFYIPVFFGGFLPWCLLSLSAPGLLKKGFANWKTEENKFRLFVRINLFWFAGVIGLFTLIKTKLPTYILPCAPAFLILMTMQLEVLARAHKLKRLVPAIALISAALLAGTMVYPMLKGYVRVIVEQNIWIFAPLAVSLIACWIGVLQNKFRILACAILSFAMLACGILVPRGLQAFYQNKQASFNQLVYKARDDRASIAMVFAEEPSVPWVTHQPVSRLMNAHDARQFLQNKPKPHYVLVQTAGLDRMNWFPGTHTTKAESGRWHLIEIGD